LMMSSSSFCSPT